MKIIIAIKHTRSNPFNVQVLQQALTEIHASYDSATVPVISLVTLGAQPVVDETCFASLPIENYLHLHTTDSLDAMHICELLLPVITQRTPDLLVLSPALCSMAQQTGKLMATLLYQRHRPYATSVFNRNQMRTMVIREMHNGAHTVLLPEISPKAAQEALLANHSFYCSSGYMSV